MTGSKARTALAIGAAALVAGCASLGAPSGGGGGQRVGRPMPDLSIKTLSGREIRLASYRGKVVLLDIWASWCEPCRDELPQLDDIAVRLKARGVEVIAVSVDEDRAQAQAFLEARRKWHMILGHDPSIADQLQPATMPTSYVVDREGTLRYVNGGFRPGDGAKIEARLRDLAGARGAP